MEGVLVNKQFLKNMLFILSAICWLVMTVQAQPASPNCDGNSYPLQFQSLESLPDSDTTIHSSIRLNATRKLRLVDAVISYELYYPPGSASTIIETVPFKNDSHVRNVSPNQQFNIDHTHPWSLTLKPDTLKVQISRSTRTGAKSVLICLLFHING